MSKLIWLKIMIQIVHALFLTATAVKIHECFIIIHFSLSFTTSYNSQFSENIYYTIFNMLSDEPTAFKVHDWMDSNTYDVSIYRMANFDVFKETYETFEEKHKSLDLTQNELIMTEELNTINYNYRNYINLKTINQEHMKIYENSWHKSFINQ